MSLTQSLIKPLGEIAERLFEANGTIYRSGWSKNQTVNTIRIGKELKHVVNEEFYLCPDCNKLFLR